ncbi:hypothetical protein Q5P01_000950 [Channa striata]|uniref:Uncharacterized protein n=1 Tax=Channa striata TaxID=64152 RepID=A0AA88IJG5_CHASR|nr:hypothetical protein Q5P01_000950 [Channa striata]
MATEPIFQMFPRRRRKSCVPAGPESGELGESDRFLQKHYPMLYMNVSAREHPSIESVRCEAEETRCLLCRTLDRNTLDSVRVLEPHEVAPYLNSCGQDFTEKQVNVHLAHSVGEENLAGVLQNMSVDLIAGSYSLASAASLRVMNRVQTHMGRVFFAADQDMAKVHNDAVKQFMGLAATCQSLMKQRQGKGEKGPVTSNSSSSSSSYSSSSSSSPHPLLDSARTFLCATFVFVLTVTTEAGGEEPYGYAPYVWVSVQTCNTRSGWCVGSSATGFALDRGGDGAGSTGRSTDPRCTHYCPGKITANWRGTREHSGDLETHTAGGFLLGAYVRKLDRSSCVEVPGGFGCSDRVVPTLPLNKISILLHASPGNRAYYLGEDASAECEPGPQCAAYKLLRRTLYAPASSRRWPDAEDVLAIRNSPYACVLAYAGLGDAESLGACHSQLGDHCFESEGNKFCVGNSRSQWTGLTNADAQASAPLVICEVSDSRSMRSRGPAYAPTPQEIRDFVGPSSCDATILPVDRALYSPPSAQGRLSLALDASAFLTVAEAGHVVMKVPFDECLIPVSSSSADFSSVARSVAETLARAITSTYSTALLLDASGWGAATNCTRSAWNGTNFTEVASSAADALTREGVSKIFLGLPRSRELLGEIGLRDWARSTPS